MFIRSVLYYNNYIYIYSSLLFFIVTTTNLLNADVSFTKIYIPSTPPLSIFFQIMSFSFHKKVGNFRRLYATINSLLIS